LGRGYFKVSARGKALKFLEEGKVSFLKAAQMAGLSPWDFADLVREKGDSVNKI